MQRERKWEKLLRLHDMLNRKYIIFGRNVGNVLGQIRSFGEAGISTHIIWYGDMPEPVKSSRYVSSFVEVKNEEEGIAILKEKFADNPNKNVLSTDNDGIVSSFDMHYNELKDWFIFFNAGEQGRLTKMMTKMQQCKLAAEKGLNIPLSEVVHVGDLPKQVKYPIFTKSLDSFDYDWKSSVSICNSEKELMDYYSKRVKDSEILLQEYVAKKNEYILQGISFDNGNVLYLPIEGGYYRLPKDAYGSYLFFKGYRGGEELKQKLLAMFKEIRYNGVFEIEFLQDKNDKLYFLEINFRHTLWNHTFTDMGINLSTIWADSMIANKLVLNGASIRKEPHNLMREFQDWMRCMKDGNQSLIGWFKDVKKTDSFVIWDKKDKKPFFVYLYAMVKHIIKKHIL